jgi:mRNA interferase RelE/StbE
MRYTVHFKPSARKALLKLPTMMQRRLVEASDALADNPRPQSVTKLQGDENLWRIRVGNYRIVYEIHDDRLIVLVVRIGDRKDIYR